MAGNLLRVTQPAAESDEMEFWLSEVERLDEDDELGFTVDGNKDVFSATEES